MINMLDLPFFTDSHLQNIIYELAELGVLILMFMAGLDLHIRDLAHSSKTAALAGVLGMLFPLLMGMGMGIVYDVE
jgi:Kef-type K+ transport system membrane component KefB